MKIYCSRMKLTCSFLHPKKVRKIYEIHTYPGYVEVYPHDIALLKVEPINIDGDICCQSVLAAAMMCRTKEIIKIGLFDENFFLFYEDDDLCKRVRNLKKSIIQIYNAKAIHIHGQGKSIKSSLKKYPIVKINIELLLL